MRAVVGGIEDVEGKGTELAEAVIQEDGGGLLAALESQSDTTSKGWQVRLSNGYFLRELAVQPKPTSCKGPCPPGAKCDF